MGIVVRLAAFGIALLASALAHAQQSGTPGRPERLSGSEIRALFTGSTIAGNYLNGGYFSEYHAADGRALGDNGLNLNTDACWNTDGDRVCYHYGKPPDRRTYCFTVEREGDLYSLRISDTGRLNAIARVEKGNPEGHGDGGRRWSCEDLLSLKPSGRIFVSRR